MVPRDNCWTSISFVRSALLWRCQSGCGRRVYHATSIIQRKRLSSSSSSHIKDKPIKLLPLPLAPAKQHFDLATFLSWAKSADRAYKTTTFTGTHYELTVLASLRRLGFDLVHTGGRADKGIDLLGYWYLPGRGNGDPLRILVQCKALSRKASPNVVRELEGAFAGARGVKWSSRSGYERFDDEEEEQRAEVNHTVMVMLVTPQQATKGVREAMSASRFPMAYVKLSQEDGRIEQLLWNRRAAAGGLGGISVVVRHIPKAESGDKVAAQSSAGNEDGDDVTEQEQQEVAGLKQPKVMDQEVVMMWKDEAWDWPLSTAVYYR